MMDAPCPPSSEQVFEAIVAEGGMADPTQIQERTGLSRRTVFVALKCLSDMKRIAKTMTFQDTRRRFYKSLDA